ncbi:MAG TPA: hypothetical protein VKV77_05245 [Methylovirgula sp.]|nr:hypothetical protein [Methylovirgula sp.]
MISKLFLGAALAAAMAAPAYAGPLLAPVSELGLTITKVAEGCGQGFWRGPDGRCHPFAHSRVCPRGYHLGPEGRRCWPNQS